MSLPRAVLLAALLAVLSNGAALAQVPAAAETAPAAQAAEPAPAVDPAAQPQSPEKTPAATQVAAPAPTATGPQPSPLTPATRPVGTSASSMVSGLLFLLALVLGAVWLIKRSGGMPALRGGSSMKVVAALSVGPRERVVLIEMGGQQWLLGVGSGSVNTLHHFEQPIVVGGTDDFAGKLRQLWPQGIGQQGVGK